MPRAITCPRCAKQYVIRDAHVGHAAQCACGQVQTIPVAAPEADVPSSWLDSAGLLFTALTALFLSVLAAGGVAAWIVLDQPQKVAPEPPALPTTPEAPKEKEKPVTPEGTGQPTETVPSTDGDGAVKSPVLNNEQLNDLLLKSATWIINSEGTGSGGVLHVGHRLVVTNHHVVGADVKVLVMFPERKPDGTLIKEKDYYRARAKEGKAFPAVVLVKDKDRDLAILQLVDRCPVGTVELKISPHVARDASKLASVGNPGINSGLWVFSNGTVRQRTEDYPPFFKHACLQTDLPINRGDSGSPVVNERGHVVGVNFAGIDKDLQGRPLLTRVMLAVDRNELLFLLKPILAKLGISEEELIAPDVAVPATARVKAMIRDIESTDRKVSQRGVDGLHRVEPEGAREAVPALVDGLVRFDDDKYRRTVIRELDRIGPPPVDQLDCLKKLTALAYPPGRLYAVEAIKRLGHHATAGIPVLLEALKDKDTDVRLKALAVLRVLAPSARRQAFQTLLETSNDADEDVAKAAFNALCEVGKLTTTEIDLLVEAVRDEKRRYFVRRFAAFRLGEQELLAVKAGPVLTRVLEADKDDHLLQLAAQALGRIGDRSQTTLQALVRHARTHPAEVIRLECLNAVARLDLSAFTTGQMLERLTQNNEKSPQIRKRIEELLSNRLAALKGSEMKQELQPLLVHPQPGIALIGIGHVTRRKDGDGTAELVPDLVRLLKHDNLDVAAQSLTALHVVGSASKAGVPEMLKLLPDVSKERKPDVAYLIGLLDPKNPKAQEAVLPILVDAMQVDRLRRRLVAHEQIQKVFVAMGQPAVEAIFKRLDTLMKNDTESTDHRRNLYFALQQLGPDCRSADNYDRLKGLRDRDPRLRIKNDPTAIAAGKALAAMAGN